MTSILSRTISSVLDKKLVLPFAEAARTMTIGNNWNSIGLGMRYAFTDSGANITSSPMLWFGFMSQPVETLGVLSNGLLPASTSNFVGLNAGGGSNWTRSTGPVRYSSLLGRYYKTGSVSADSMATNYLHSANPVVRVALILTLSKSAGLGTAMGSVGVQSVDAMVDISDINILKTAMMEGDPESMKTSLNTALGVTGYGINTYSQSSPFSEAGGALDSVLVSWNKGDCDLEVSEVLFRRIS